MGWPGLANHHRGVQAWDRRRTIAEDDGAIGSDKLRSCGSSDGGVKVDSFHFLGFNGDRRKRGFCPIG
jgi:hypothetical protein